MISGNESNIFPYTSTGHYIIRKTSCKGGLYNLHYYYQDYYKKIKI